MSTLQNHRKPRHLDQPQFRLMAGHDDTPKTHYQRLINMGFSEASSSELSGWHPTQERGAQVAAWFAVAIALAALVWAFAPKVPEVNAPLPPSSQQSAAQPFPAASQQARECP